MALCGKCHREAAPGALYCAFCGTAIVPERAADDDPYIGQTFKGMYFIQQCVGGGGMGQVYKAIHTTLEVPVALKILKKALLSDPSVVQRFHREARAASRLRHPNVIAVTDFGQTNDGTLFMAMEFIAGKSLGRLIAQEFPLSERRVVHIAAQILAALAEAHAAQILHRDLKPENVMLESRRDEPDSVKVLDFGIAKIQLPEGGKGTLTQAGLVCGTPGYMSPEQWSGEPLDARSDLYSVGVILYEMLTGKLPYEADTPMAMMRKHLTERPLPPSQRRADGRVSPDLEALVMRVLSAVPADRPASAEELRAALLACALAPDSAVRPAPTPPSTVVLDRGAAAAAEQRSASPVATPRPGVAAQPPGTASPPGRRTPAPTAAPGTPPPAMRPPTPPGRRRPTPGPGAAATPRPAEAQPRTPAPGPEPSDLGEAAIPPPRPRGYRIIVGAAVAVAALALAIAYAVVGSGAAKAPISVSRVAPAVVPAQGGTPLVISGTGFSAGSTVTLGGAAAPVGHLDATSIRATAPAHAAGVVDVVVIAPDGRRGSLAAGLTFAEAALPAPSPAVPPKLARVAPETGPAAGGIPVTLTGSGFSSDAAVTFDGTPARVVEAAAAAITAIAPPHEAGRIDVAVTNPDGQRATLDGAFSYLAQPKPAPRPPKAAPKPAPKAEPSARAGTVVSAHEALNAVPTPAAVTGDGVLSIQVEPYGDVYLDGRPYGDAPREFRVTAGTYLVGARHPQLGQREQRITVRAGERARWTADFSKKP